jgi:ABC-type antimicrobial peptide transport system permease subunit
MLQRNARTLKTNGKKKDMVLKRYKVVSLLIIICFLSAFFSLYNGFSAIIEAKNNCKAEVKFGYTYKVSVFVYSDQKINLIDLIELSKYIDQSNVYIEDLRFYYDESGYVYKPDIILCQNEKLPYPLKNNVKRLAKGEIIVPNNINFKDTAINIHDQKINIRDEIDTNKCVTYTDTFVLNASTFFDLFGEENEISPLELRICSNKDNIYATYNQLKKIMQEQYPDSYISYDDVENNESVLSGFENEKTILGILLYLFAIINVTIVSYYWINVRKREIAIRKAFGHTNIQIILMLIKEFFLIIGVAAIIAILVQILVQISRGTMQFGLDSIGMILMYLGMIFIASIISSLLPINYILKIHPAEGVKN